MNKNSAYRHPESGNVIFFILLAVFLIGLVTAALRSGGEGANIDKETILIRASQVRQYASELERGVAFIMREGHSESDIRFAHPNAHTDYGDITNNPATQVFSETGGGVEYMLPFSDISSATYWEFYGNTHAPDVGADNAGDERPELIAVLPNVTEAFCIRINAMNDQNATPKEDAGCDINNTALRFSSSTLYQDGAVNVLDNDPVTSFTAKPAMQACVQCGGGASYHFYHVLLAR